jgi:uncharacterized protein (TIRG00374 family)
MGSRRRQPSWYFVVGLVLSAALLYLAFRGADWRQIVASFREVRPGHLVLAAAIMSGSYLLRSIRWRVLLSAERSIGVVTVFLANLVGYMGNNFLPARAGELVRSVIIGRVEGLRKSYVFATVVVERVLDTGALVLMGLVAMASIDHIPDWFQTITLTMGVLALVTIVGLCVAPHMDRVIARIVNRLPVSSGTSHFVLDILEQFFLGMRAFRHIGRALAFGTLTVLIWLLDGVILIVIARAMNLSLDLPEAIVLLAALGLSSALPSVPGYVGIYQFVAATLLVPFGYTQNEALAYIIAFQALIYAVVTFWGVLGLVRFGAQEFWPRRAAPLPELPGDVGS